MEYDDEQGNIPDFSLLPEPTCNEVLLQPPREYECRLVLRTGSISKHSKRWYCLGANGLKFGARSPPSRFMRFGGVRTVYPYRAHLPFPPPLCRSCAVWIWCGRRSQKPARTGRGAAILVSTVIVFAAILTAVADVIQGNASPKSPSPSDPSQAQDGLNTTEEVDQQVFICSMAWNGHVGQGAAFDATVG